MRKNLAIFLIALVAVAATGAFFVSRNARQTAVLIANPNYNPNYADAIQLKKPELCQHINYALQSGPTDDIIKVRGDEAVELCKSQVVTGFGCECDSNEVLNNMRKGLQFTL